MNKCMHVVIMNKCMHVVIMNKCMHVVIMNKCMHVVIHEFTLTFNLKAIVSIFWLAVLGEGSKPGIWPEPRELPRPRCGMK